VNKTRFVMTSALVLLGFGLMGGDCDCDSSGTSVQGSVLEAPQVGGVLPLGR
jgi:hypothetical protein